MRVLLMGFARVGKDLAASGISLKRLAFADELKKDADKMLAAIGIKSDWNEPEFKKRWRPLLVSIGAGMRATDPYCWISRLIATIMTDEFDRSSLPLADFIITDGRYVNEAMWIYDTGGLVVRIDRPGYGPANDEEARSFAEIEERYPDMIRVCNDGTPEQLSAKVQAIIDEFGSR